VLNINNTSTKSFSLRTFAGPAGSRYTIAATKWATLFGKLINNSFDFAWTQTKVRPFKTCSSLQTTF
jgi:hypothetical protein